MQTFDNDLTSESFTRTFFIFTEILRTTNYVSEANCFLLQGSAEEGISCKCCWYFSLPCRLYI